MMLLRMLTKQTVVSADRCSSACSRMVFQWLACAVGMPGGRALREGCGRVAGAKDPNAVEGSIVLLADPPHHGDAETAECPLWVKSRHFGLGQGCPLYPQERTLLDTPLSSSEPVRSGSAQVWGLATVRLANPVGSRKFGEVVLSCGRVE